MKNILLAMVLASGTLTLAPAATLPFPDTASAKQIAREQNKPALIIWHGSDWLHDTDRLCREWSELPGMGLPLILGQYNDRLGQEGDTRNKTLPIESYNLPVAVLLAPDGSFMCCFPPEITGNAQKLTAAVKALLPSVKPFGELVQEARSGQGEQAAEAAGKALDLLPIDSALRQRELTDIINRQDPQDASGYRSLYAMDHMSMFREINRLLKGGADGNLTGSERDFTAAETYVLKTLDNPKLRGERLQQWLAGLYYVQKEKALADEKRDLAPVLATLGKIVKIDPTTQTGIGAAAYLKYWDPTSYYTIEDYRYDESMQTLRFEKEWRVNVTSSMDGQGEYVFSLLPRLDGSMATRDYRLYVNDKEIAKPKDTDENTNTKTVTFDVPEILAGAKVEVRLRAQCYDGWLGCAGEIVMEKK